MNECVCEREGESRLKELIIVVLEELFSSSDCVVELLNSLSLLLDVYVLIGVKLHEPCKFLLQYVLVLHMKNSEVTYKNLQFYHSWFLDLQKHWGQNQIHIQTIRVPL